MKLSKYSTDIEIDKKIHMIYNTISRKYVLYPIEQKDAIWELVYNPNRTEYTIAEADLIHNLFKRGILIDDKRNELRGLEYLENKACYQDRSFRITVFTTNACNFRCSYCSQEHKTRILEEQVVQRIIEAIDAISKNVKFLEIMWFGGEPLLQYEKIKKIMLAAVPICNKNKCKVMSHIVTNGYLLTEPMVKEMRKMQINRMQITVDGNRENHNARRFLADGTATYDQIYSNICMVLKQGISVTLRINIDHESVEDVPEILYDIPEKYRHLVVISICNLFQEKEKQSTFSLYYQAIKMGYQYSGRYNDYSGCQSCGYNSLVVDTDGKIRFCTNSEQESGVIGEIKDQGVISYKNKELYEEKLMLSVRENEECKNCIDLPFCIGNCKYIPEQKTEPCTKQHPDGLSLVERARLDYYSDIFAHKENVVQQN